jgi:DNA-binding transcriptional ArsR family regulator
MQDGAAILGRLARNRLRQHVLFKYSEAVTSPSDVAAALGARLNLVSYHTKVLLAAGLIELVRTEPRRGATQHFYRSCLRGVIEDAEWEQLPIAVRRGLTRVTIDGAAREAADALPLGGMDDPTSHLSRSYFLLDRRARTELASLLQETFAKAQAIDVASRERGGHEAAPCELVIMSFERASRP